MSQPVTTAEIRAAYLEFFHERGHTIHPSASLVPASDPTTLFTVAGMAQFKDMFLGRGVHPFSRATTCQKCIRTNDIENVGRTPRHHTFFEMLGNFSFNDYFKQEAITWAWEFLTGVLGLDTGRLRITVNRIDDEAYRIWTEEVGFPAERIYRLGDDENFWPDSAPTEGPTGPGGCCSEIFWDFQTNGDPDDDPTRESGRFVEIWNLVFPEFNVTEPRIDGRYTLEELGRRNVDTGMGLERVACVMQGVYNNFDTDLLQTIVQATSRVAEAPYAAGTDDPDAEATNARLRRIADHLRAVTFCVADGALPGNTGRGYIVRRLIRRATLDIDKLGVDAVRLHELVEPVVAAMGEVYPEILQRRALVEQALESEEGQFRRTLRRGLDLFAKALDRHRGTEGGVFSGDDAFELFTTYGFPKEMTEELVRAEGMRIDEEAFARRMERFAEISKGGREIQVFDDSELLAAKPRLGPTVFVGYDRLACEAELTFIEREGEEVAEAPTGARIRFTLDRSPFYGEAGGEVGDRGLVYAPDGDLRIHVADTQRDGDLIVHHGSVIAGTAVPGPVLAEVDGDQRRRITAHHSATHLLHAALCELFGDHVEQQGSRVDADGLRFDFNHPRQVGEDQLRAIERRVGEWIAAALPVTKEVVPIAEAKRRGAKAQFDEKYGAEVRVVSMGTPPISVEFCGGCHVENTGEIQDFRIGREEAVATGVRRIQALAGEPAREAHAVEAALAERCAAACGLTTAEAADITELAGLLKTPPEELPERLQTLTARVAGLEKRTGGTAACEATDLPRRVRELQAEQKRLDKLARDQEARAALTAVDDILAGGEEVAGIPLYRAGLEGVDSKALRELAAAVTQRLESWCLVLGSAVDGKALLLVAVSPDLVDRGVAAGDLVGRLASVVGGGGGGRPELAQAGGKRPEALGEALERVRDLLTGGDG